MFHLVYVSSAVEPFSKTELVELLHVARANNERLGITGMLLYRDGNFMQVLEGEEPVVRDLYARIERDPRQARTLAYGRVRAVEGVRRDWETGTHSENLTLAVSFAGHEIDERIVRARQVRVHGAHHLGGRVRPGDRQHLRVRCADEAAAVLGAEAAGDDHLAVLGQRLADRVERLGDGGVDETAGVDDDEIRAFVRGRDRVALGPELGDDLFRVDERLRAAERDEPDARRRVAAVR